MSVVLSRKDFAPAGNCERKRVIVRLTDLRRLPARELGKELRVLMGLVPCPCVVGAQSVEKVVFCHSEKCQPPRHTKKAKPLDANVLVTDTKR